jgi:hypothetical protein
MDSLLFKFVGNIDAYHCPSDMSSIQSNKLVLSGGGAVMRARSVSMNPFMNPINAWTVDRRTPTPIRNFRRLADIGKPDLTFVTIDESPATINDGWFVYDPNSSTSWLDIPASEHNGGGTLSYSDGHSAIKSWHDPAIFERPLQIGIASKDNGVDLKWLQARTTY